MRAASIESARDDVLRRIAIGLLGALLGALWLTASPALAGPAQADARLDNSIQSLIQMKDGPPGVAAVVQRGNQRKLHSFGSSDLGAGGDPIRIRDHTRIASVSKAFSGAVALLLVEKHRLRLDDPIGPLLPELPAIWGPVTLRQLLNHTSGLPSYSADPAFLSYLVAHLKDYISPQQAISFVFDDPLAFTPGTTYEYSNTDNIVIGLLAERATGRSYEDLLRDLVIRRLRLRETSLPSGIQLPAPFVSGYVFDGSDKPLENVSEELSPSSTWAAGAIVSSPRDQNRFIRAWGGGKLLNRKLRRQQTSFILDAAGEPPGPGENSGGLTLFRYRLRCGTVFGHTGNFPGYTQFIASSRDGSRSTSVTANLQLDVKTGPPGMFPALREVFEKASCAALARGPG